MPTYSYACTECDNRFDVVQAFTDDLFFIRFADLHYRLVLGSATKLRYTRPPF